MERNTSLKHDNRGYYLGSMENKNNITNKNKIIKIKNKNNITINQKEEVITQR